jgi:hypothetical protein
VGLVLVGESLMINSNNFLRYIFSRECLGYLMSYFLLLLLLHFFLNFITSTIYTFSLFYIYSCSFLVFFFFFLG